MGDAMRKRLIIFAVVVAAGLCLTKPWQTERKTPLQDVSGFILSQSPANYLPDPDFPLSKELALSQAEESEPLEVIDLTQLQLPRPDPVALPELPPDFLAA